MGAGFVINMARRTSRLQALARRPCIHGKRVSSSAAPCVARPPQNVSRIRQAVREQETLNDGPVGHGSCRFGLTEMLGLNGEER
jgi:hypothetical protein